jgi:hypothetical protein
MEGKNGFISSNGGLICNLSMWSLPHVNLANEHTDNTRNDLSEQGISQLKVY